MKNENLSNNAKLLYYLLTELEQQYAGDKGYFFRSNEALAKDLNVSLKTLKNIKRELLEKCPDYIKTWQETLPGSAKHITAYKLLK